MEYTIGTKRILTFMRNGSQKELEFHMPNDCPLCSKKTSNTPIYAYINLDHSDIYDLKAYALILCESCNRSYCAEFFREDYYTNFKPINTTQIIKSQETFPKFINEVFPEFVELYKQAETAELNELKLICGAAYRKSLEFLVKHYALKYCNKTLDDLKNSKYSLHQCIEDCFKENNKLIFDLALKAKLLGNDETHFIKEYNEDVEMLKELIKLVTTQIHAILLSKTELNKST